MSPFCLYVFFYRSGKRATSPRAEGMVLGKECPPGRLSDRWVWAGVYWCWAYTSRAAYGWAAGWGLSGGVTWGGVQSGDLPGWYQAM